jgi:hypothetical protein
MSAAEQLTLRELEVMAHATAWHLGKKRRLYRNYFSASEGTDDMRAILKLVDRGLMHAILPPSENVPYTTFRVTADGIETLKRWRP